MSDTDIPVFTDDDAGLSEQFLRNVIADSIEVAYVLEGNSFNPHTEAESYYDDLQEAGEFRNIQVSTAFPAGDGLSYALDMDIHWYYTEGFPAGGVNDCGIPFRVTGAMPDTTETAEELIDRTYTDDEQLESRIRPAIDSLFHRNKYIPEDGIHKLLFYADVNHMEERGEPLTGATYEVTWRMPFSPDIRNTLEKHDYHSRRKVGFDSKVYYPSDDPIYNWHTHKFIDRIYPQMSIEELNAFISETAAYQDASLTDEKINLDLHRRS